MAYDIWLSLSTRDCLSNLKQNDPETYDKIRNLLHDLSLQREDFKTGTPERIEVFIAFPVRKRYIIDIKKLNQQKFKCTTQV